MPESKVADTSLVVAENPAAVDIQEGLPPLSDQSALEVTPKEPEGDPRDWHQQITDLRCSLGIANIFFEKITSDFEESKVEFMQIPSLSDSELENKVTHLRASFDNALETLCKFNLNFEETRRVALALGNPQDQAIADEMARLRASIDRALGSINAVIRNIEESKVVSNML